MVNLHSIIVEAAVAYISHNYGQSITDMAVGARVWFEAAYMNIGAWLIQLVGRMRDALTTTVTFAAELPQMLLHYGKCESLSLNEIHKVLTLFP